MTSTPENIPQYEGPADYRGPAMSYLIRTHTLADQIIATHPHAPANILDASELALLRLYITGPSTKTDFLREHGMLDGAGQEAGAKAQGEHGSLVGFAIASDAFDEREMEALRRWFASGVLDAELEGVRPTGQGEKGGE